MKKALVSLLLCVVMLFGMLPMTAFAVETPTITISGLTAPLAGQSADAWLDDNSPVFSPDYDWGGHYWVEGAFDNYEEMFNEDEFLGNFVPGRSYTLYFYFESDTPLPLNATLDVPGSTCAVYDYYGEDDGWYYADIMIVYTVETPTITVTGLTAPLAGQSAEEWLDGISPVLSPDYEWANAEWYEGAFDNYADMMSNNEWGVFIWNFGSGQSYTLALSLASDNPTTLPLNATVNVPGATCAAYEYWGEGYSGDWYYACILIVYTIGYEVSFDANGGTGTMADVTDISGEYTLPANGFTAPSNKAFKAWSVGGEEKQPGDKITVSANTTVTAVWQDVVKYDLWVGGVQVTGANAGNITGAGITGAVSYDATTKTLTLNNATITGAHEFAVFDDVSGIYGKETLKINLIGNNTITGSVNGGSSYGIYIDDNGNLTFTGTGSLTVSAADASENKWSVAVFADGSITVEDSCTITAYCGTGAWVACAFKSYAAGNKYNLPNATGILVAGNKNAPEATNFEVCNGDPDEFQYLRIAPGYTVTLNKNGGTITSGNVTCYFVDTGATLPTEVTKANSIFGGWYDNAECTGTAITEIPVGSTGEKEFWAKWTTEHTCDIEPVAKDEPSCTEGGKEAYYKCEGCGKYFEDAEGTVEIDDIDSWGNLPENGHTAGNEWESDEDNHWHVCSVAGCGAVIDSSKEEHTPDREQATETDPVKCSVCLFEMEAQLEHTHVFDKEAAEEQYLASKANCTDPARYYKSCKCGEKGTETFASGEKLGHTAGNEWESDGTYHWHICSVAGCGAVIDSSKEEHTPDREQATETDPVKCSVCEYELAPVLQHTHTHGTEWESDEDNHWNECACGDKANTAAHEDNDGDGLCDSCEHAVSAPDNGNPPTGDDGMLSLWLLLCIGAAGVFAATLLTKKHAAR